MLLKTENSSILSVSQLSYQIKKQLNFLGVITVQGEINSLKKHSSGHLYFSVKDQQAQLNCVMFRQDAQTLSQLPKEGDQVVLFGQIDVYLPRGSYQLIVKRIRQTGLGELLIQLEKLKQELKQLGWFNKENKKPLPKHPKKIGVITSPTGAVIQDIINILKRRSAYFHIIIYPVHVQGEKAPKEIAQAVKTFNDSYPVDVIIIARGGGSIEDLLAFNEKIVAQSIFESTIPIISAVGHETDYTICDLVADKRAPTPSAGAEIVMQETSQLHDFLHQIKKQLQLTMTLILQKYQERVLRYATHPLFSSSSILFPFMQRIDESKELLKRSIEKVFEQKQHNLLVHKKQMLSLRPSNQLQFSQEKLLSLRTLLQKQQDYFYTQKNQMLSQIAQQTQNVLIKKQEQIQQKKQELTQKQDYLHHQLSNIVKQKVTALTHIKSHLSSLDPKSLMEKGYSILFDEQTDSVISSLEKLSIGQTVAIHLKDGKVKAQINTLQKDIHGKSNL